MLKEGRACCPQRAGGFFRKLPFEALLKLYCSTSLATSHASF